MYREARQREIPLCAAGRATQSKKIERIISISAKYLETPRLKRSDNVIRANRVAVEHFVEMLQREYASEREEAWGNPLWRNVPKELIAGVIRSFDVHPLNISFQTEDLGSYLTRTAEDRLQLWDVVLPRGDGAAISLGGLTIKANARKVEMDASSILVSGRHRRVASRGIERTGLTPALVQEISKRTATTVLP